MKVVEALTESRQEKLNRVKAVEKEKDTLEGGKMEAEAFMIKEKDIRKKKNVIYQMNMVEVGEEKEATKEKTEEISSKLEAEKSTLAESTARLNEIETGHNAQVAEYEGLATKLKEVKDEFASYERRDVKMREDIKFSKAQIKTLESKVKAEDKKKGDLTKKADNATKSIPTLNKKVEEATKVKETEDGKLEKVRGKEGANEGRNDGMRVEG